MHGELMKCSMLEICIEIIELGTAGVVDRLFAYEPIPMSSLLGEASRRTGLQFESPEDFLSAVLSATVKLGEPMHSAVCHAILAKKIEHKFKLRNDGENG